MENVVDASLTSYYFINIFSYNTLIHTHARTHTHTQTHTPFSIVSSMVEKLLANACSGHFRGVYTRQVWMSRSVQFLRYSGVTHTHTHTHRHFSKPFTVTLRKGEGQIHIIKDTHTLAS